MATSKGLGQFARRMEVVADLMLENTNKVIRRAALRADEAVVLSTPVDTGRARANWITSVGQPSSGQQTPEHDPLRQGIQVISGWKIGAGTIFITNNLPYIIPLDEGSSRQSPSGMTKFGIQAAQAELSRAKLLKG